MPRKVLGKIISKKKERGQALLGRPASFSAHSRAQPSSPSPPRAWARPAFLHRMPAMWWPYVGDVAAAALLRPAWPGRDATPLPYTPPFSLPPSPSLIFTPAPSSAAMPLPAELRRSPSAVSSGHLPHQAHRWVRHHRSKPLRTLNGGGKPTCDCNGSPEFNRPRRSAPPHENPLFPAPFYLFLCASCSGWPNQAPTALHRRSTLPVWPGHGEQRRCAAMHADEDDPDISQGHHRVRLAAGSTLVLTPRPEAPRRRGPLVGGIPSSRLHWPVGSEAHCQPQGDRVGCRSGCV